MSMWHVLQYYLFSKTGGEKNQELINLITVFNTSLEHTTRRTDRYLLPKTSAVQLIVK